MSGDRLGPWTLHEPIGRGGMGVVHRATDDAGRLAAVKVLEPSFATREALERFAREAAVLERLDHPGIVRVLGSGHDDARGAPRAWIAMEFVEGRTLADARPAPTDDWRAAVRLLARIAAAIAHAHESGVVHRDLKPANVIVRPDGEPCVLDFGIARPIERDGTDDAPATRTGMLVGTLRWMSPEQVVGVHSAVGPAADVHALGLLAHELLTGQSPWQPETETLAEAMVAIASQSPRPLRECRPEVPRDLGELVARVLAKSPSQRPSAAEVADELQRILAGRPTRRTLRSRLLRALAIALGIALVAAAVGRPVASWLDDRLLNGEGYSARRALDLAERTDAVLAGREPERLRQPTLDACAQLAAGLRRLPTTPVRRGARTLLVRSMWRLLPEPAEPAAVWDHYVLRTDRSWQAVQERPEQVLGLRPRDRRWQRAFTAIPASRLFEEAGAQLAGPHRVELPVRTQRTAHFSARRALDLWSVERGHAGEPLDSLWRFAAADSLRRPGLWLLLLETGVDLAELEVASGLDTLAVLASRIEGSARARRDPWWHARAQLQLARIVRMGGGDALAARSALPMLDSALATARAIGRTQLARDVVMERGRLAVALARDTAARDRARLEAVARIAEAESWRAEWPVDTDLPALLAERARIENDLGESRNDAAWFVRAQATADRGIARYPAHWVRSSVPLELESARSRLRRFERSGDPTLMPRVEASLQRVSTALAPHEWPRMQRHLARLRSAMKGARRRYGVPAL